ncbi:MAG TPA: hypothetical protein VHU85_13390 [Acidimicrobiales bacterium]|jgi:hypothetical protein|nr:hypothetical protein [Acidimicrobiales bacterium]
MTSLSKFGPRSRSARRADAEGELYSSPAFLIYVWTALIILVSLEAAKEVFRIGGPASLYELWFHDFVLGAAAVLILARASFEPTARRAWLAFGVAMALWCVGDVSWTLAYGNPAAAPYPSFADILWVLFYPFMAIGIIRLIQVKLPEFDLHRWMDGIAVILLVLSAGFALVIQPVAEHAHKGRLATIVDFSYPVLDVLLIGAVLGVFGLLAWHPDRMWVLIGLGTLAMTVADAIYAIQQARGVVTDNRYDFVWTLGALLIAYAAWVRVPRELREIKKVTGLQAVALPLIAQALAGGLQIYALFKEVGKSERIITLVVLVIASVQIILNRPRPASSPVTPTLDVETLSIGPLDAAEREVSHGHGLAGGDPG